MGNRAAMVSQADIARVIWACRQEGVRVMRIVVRKDSVSIEAANGDENNPQDFLALRTNPRWCSDGEHATTAPSPSPSRDKPSWSGRLVRPHRQRSAHSFAR